MANRPFEHIKAQQEGKARDLDVCQICGSTENVEGHHIIDYQFSGAANADNIISLCHNCHMDVHKGKMTLLKF